MPTVGRTRSARVGGQWSKSLQPGFQTSGAEEVLGTDNCSQFGLWDAMRLKMGVWSCVLLEDVIWINLTAFCCILLRWRVYAPPPSVTYTVYVCVCVFSTDGAPDRGLCSRPLRDTLWQFPAWGASERQSWQRRRMSPSVTPDSCTSGTPPNPRKCAEDGGVHPAQLSRYPVSFSKANIWLQKTFFPDLTTDSLGTMARRGRRWLNYLCGQSVLKHTRTRRKLSLNKTVFKFCCLCNTSSLFYKSQRHNPQIKTSKKL